VDRMFTNLLTNIIQTDKNLGALSPQGKPAGTVSDLGQIRGFASSFLSFPEILSRFHLSQPSKNPEDGAFELPQSVYLSPQINQKFVQTIEQILSGINLSEKQSGAVFPEKLVVAFVQQNQISSYPYQVKLKDINSGMAFSPDGIDSPPIHQQTKSPGVSQVKNQTLLAPHANVYNGSEMGDNLKTNSVLFGTSIPKENPLLQSVGVEEDGASSIVFRIETVEPEMPPVASRNRVVGQNIPIVQDGGQILVATGNPVTPGTGTGVQRVEFPRELILTAFLKEGKVLMRMQLVREKSEAHPVALPAEKDSFPEITEIPSGKESSLKIKTTNPGNSKSTQPVISRAASPSAGLPPMVILTDSETSLVSRLASLAPDHPISTKLLFTKNEWPDSIAKEQMSYLSESLRSGELKHLETEQPQLLGKESLVQNFSKGSRNRKATGNRNKIYHSVFPQAPSSEFKPSVPIEGKTDASLKQDAAFPRKESNSGSHSLPAREASREFQAVVGETTDGKIHSEQEGNANVHRKNFSRTFDSFGSISKMKSGRSVFTGQKTAGTKLIKNPFEFVQSLAREIKLSFTNSNREIFIRMKPEALGSIFIRLKMKDNRMSGRVEVSSSEVYQTLVNHRQELNQRLQELNLRFDELDFSLLPEGKNNTEQHAAKDANTAGKNRNIFSLLPDSGIEEGDEKMPGRRMLNYSTFEYIA